MASNIHGSVPYPRYWLVPMLSTPSIYICAFQVSGSLQVASCTMWFLHLFFFYIKSSLFFGNPIVPISLYHATNSLGGLVMLWPPTALKKSLFAFPAPHPDCHVNFLQILAENSLLWSFALSAACWYEEVNKSVCPQCPALRLRAGQDQGEDLGRLAEPSFGNRQREVLLE